MIKICFLHPTQNAEDTCKANRHCFTDDIPVVINL